MEDLIKQALDHCGYEGEPSKENIIDCFLDMVDCGVFNNLETEEAREMIEEGELTIESICRHLLRL